MNNSNNEEPNDIGAALTAAGLAVVAAGIWSLLNKDTNNSSQNSNNIQGKLEAQKDFDRAVAFIQQGEFHQAVPLFFESLKKNPVHAPTYNLLAWIYAIHNYELDQALMFVSKAVELANNPNDRACFVDTLAEVHFRRGEWDEAVAKSFEFLNSFRLSNQIPTSPITYFRLAWCYQINQNFDYTYQFLEQAIQIDSQNPETHSLVGDVCFAMGHSCFEQERYHEAMKHYDNAITQQQNAINLATNSGISNELYRIKASTCFVGKGATYYFFEDDKHNSRSAHQTAYPIYSFNPYAAINLASLSARDGNKLQMRHWLEIGLPLILDMPPFFQKDQLVFSILNEPDFEEYRDDILGLLLSHSKITQAEYRKYLKRCYTTTAKNDLRGCIFMGGYGENIYGHQMGVQHN